MDFNIWDVIVVCDKFSKVDFLEAEKAISNKCVLETDIQYLVVKKGWLLVVVVVAVTLEAGFGARHEGVMAWGMTSSTCDT